VSEANITWFLMKNSSLAYLLHGMVDDEICRGKTNGSGFQYS